MEREKPPQSGSKGFDSRELVFLMDPYKGECKSVTKVLASQVRKRDVPGSRDQFVLSQKKALQIYYCLKVIKKKTLRTIIDSKQSFNDLFSFAGQDLI